MDSAVSCRTVLRQSNVFAVPCFYYRNSEEEKTFRTGEIWSDVYLRGKSLKLLPLDVFKQLKCTKIDLGWDLPQKPTERAYSTLTDLLAGLNRTYEM